MKKIKTTSEQFANMVQKQQIMFPDVEDRTVLMDIVMKNNWPDYPKEELLIIFSTNTVNNKLDATERDSHRDPMRWIETNQMSLFNEEAFRLPNFMYVGNKKKHYKETTLLEAKNVISGFYEQTVKEAVELGQAWADKKTKAHMIREQLDRIDHLIEVTRKAGLNPEDLTFGDVEETTFEGNARPANDPIQTTAR